MARAEETDLLQGFRFHVVAGDPNLLKFGSQVSQGGEAGFTSVTQPELTVENAEYREGTMKHTRKFPGVGTWSDGSLMRGIAKGDTKMFDWCLAALEGGKYRTDLTVYQYAREEAGARDQAKPSTARYYLWHEAFPIRAKPSGDFDATASEVSVAEMDIAVEWMEVKTA